MAISDRITSMEEHIKDSYQELKGIGLDITGFNKNLENIPRVIDNYWETLPKVSGNGTNITLDNTKEGKMKIELKGDTYQYSTTGKNLFNPIPKVTASNGITTTLNSDGSLHIEGTTTGTWFEISERIESVLPIGTYTISRKVAKSYPLRLRGVDIDNNTIDMSISSDTTSKKVTTTAEIVKYFLYVPSGITANTQINEDIYFQLETGDTATTYEPYTAGASPNPTYPQDIEVVTGGQNILVRNKNLCEPEVYPASVSGTYTIATSTTPITSPYTTPNTNRGICFVAKVEAGVTYTFSTDTTGYTYANLTCIYASKSDITNQTKKLERITGATFTPNYSGYAVIGYSAGASGTTISWNWAQLEKGNQATTYTPHQEQNYEINLGKNLCNPETIVKGGLNSNGGYTSGGVSSFDYTNGIFEITTSSQYRGLVTDYIEVEPNTTYSISYEKLTTGVTYGAISRYYDDNKQYVGNVPSANGKYLRVNISINEIGTFKVSNIQIEVGTQATTYSPYKTPIELCKIGTYQDYIYKSGADWKIHREVGKVTLNGEETQWSVWFSTAGAYSCTNYVQSLSSSSTINCISNYFIADTRANIRNNLSTIDNVCATNGGELVLVNKTYTDINDFKTWLGTHNTNVYTILATPTDETITDTELIEDLNALYYATSYQGQTNVNSNGNIASILNANALEGSNS